MAIKAKFISKKTTRNGKNTQTTIQVNDDNNRFLSNTQIKELGKTILNNKADNKKLLLRALTPIGWLTFLSYSDTIDNYEGIEDYLNGSINNSAKFNNDIAQIHITIMEYN